MIAAEPAAVRLPRGTPHVAVLDARHRELDERGLREWARAETSTAGTPYVSRSYRHPYALVAWHDEPVGVDIERTEPFDPAFLESICTPAERPLIEDGVDVASLWCGKEALAKALGDALRYDPRRLGSPMLWRDGRSGPWRAAPVPVPAGHNAWLCWRHTGD